MKNRKPEKKIDERDTMFARMKYVEGSKEYKDYYLRNKHLKEIDDNLRSKGGIGADDTVFYNEGVSEAINSNFKLLNDIKHLSKIERGSEKIEINEKRVTNIIKGLCKTYGALDVSVVELKDEHYYSHRGRDEFYGDEITENMKHKYGIVFTVQMEKEMINTAPRTPATLQSSKSYVDLSIIGLQIGYYISSLGYDSFVNMDANYLLNVVRVANDSPLGEVGRNNLLITPKNGASVRIGVVATNIPLVIDKNKTYGIKEHMCSICNLCGVTCPSKSIDLSDDENKWSINQETCYERWMMFGTDCGICISSCPLTQGIKGDERDEKSKLDKKYYEKILLEHKNKYGTRNYIKEDPKWMK